MLGQYAKDCNENYFEAGVDEVARGCLFGPVFAAAVILNKNVEQHKWLNDSKKVSKKRRAIVRQWIEENAIAWSVAYVENDNIDELNIRKCTLLAMEIAIRNLSILPNLIIVDGDYFHGTNNFGKYDDKLKIESHLPMNIPHETIVSGDATYASIAAASILAKEHHDEFIRKMVINNPDLHTRYHLLNNVGYGTAKHIQGLKEFGPTTFHRMSFLNKILSGTKFMPVVYTETIEMLLEDDEV